jgi:hypothetical protein
MKRLTGSVVMSAIWAHSLWAQSSVGKKPDPTGPIRLIQADRVPKSARKYLDALGERVIKPGQERSLVSGTIRMGENGPSEAVSWIAEFPGKLRLQKSAGRGMIVANPEKRAKEKLDDTDEEIVEALTEDTAEFFLNFAQDGMRPRFLGDNFRQKGISGSCASVDIFEAALPARVRQGSSVKHFMFDSLTGRLCRVVYQKDIRGNPTPVVTIYSDYDKLNGQVAARRIVRMNGSKVRFQIDMSNVQWTPAALDGTFE